MPHKVCSSAGCGEWATYRGRCFVCSKENERSIDRTGRAVYRSRKWQVTRRHVLFEEPMCRSCAAKGHEELAAEVDHINGDPTDNRRVNLQPLCKHCHSVKTRREQIVRVK